MHDQPVSVSAADLALLRRMDEVHLEMPWFGARGLRRALRPEFPAVGRRHIGTLGRRMSLSAQAPQPGTSRRHRGHPVYPYLLRNRVSTQPNEVWAMDITYLPMARGFVYLAVVRDWASRTALSWRASITPDSAFCVAALEDALARDGRPAIVNTDQGAQFPSAVFTDVLRAQGIQLSMDGKGCWRDPVISTFNLFRKAEPLVLARPNHPSNDPRDCRKRGEPEPHRPFEIVRELFGGICALLREAYPDVGTNRVHLLSQPVWRRKLQAAYAQPAYGDARRALQRLARELAIVNESAARGREEGLEETLTLHRLNAFAELSVSFQTTNAAA